MNPVAILEVLNIPVIITTCLFDMNIKHPLTSTVSPLQVCVLENDVPILDISAGKQSPYDGTPVAPDTIFNCFSVTKGVAAGAVHMLAERYCTGGTEHRGVFYMSYLSFWRWLRSCNIDCFLDLVLPS